MLDKVLSAKLLEYAPSNLIEQEGLRSRGEDFFSHHLVRLCELESLL